ncbi:site-specific integrase [Gammaproteobacteria bacterium]|nr:site-specific integrase [Gammaproteobacteria bacterium]
MSNDNHNLALKGSKKDIWYVVKRVPKSIDFLFDKPYINKSTKTSDIKLARKFRDEILAQIDSWVEEAKLGRFNMLLDKYSKMNEDDLFQFRDMWLEQNIYQPFPWAGYKQQGDLPDPPPDVEEELDAINVALGVIVKPSKYGLTMNQAMLANFRYRDYGETTILNHKRSVKRLNDFLNTKDVTVRKVKRRHALEFKKFLEKTDISNGTIARYFQDLHVIWKYGKKEEELDRENPFAEAGIKIKRGRKSYVGWDIDDLRKVINTMKDERDKLVIYLAWYTGSRLGECLSVRPDDIYKDKKSDIWLISIKPDRAEEEYLNKIDKSYKTENARRIVPIHKELLRPLQKFKIEGKEWKRNTPNKYSKFFGRQKHKIKNPINPVSKQYSFHSIRHNVCTNFDRAKVEERVAARLAGHSTVGATMTYGYYSEGEDYNEALEAVNKLPVL